MHIPKPSEGGGDFELAPVGTHMAVCYRVIDLGTQETTWEGKIKAAHKVLLGWELTDERMSDGRPFIVSQRYTWSMHEKATLRKHLEAWRGKAFADKDFGTGGFDIKNVLGVPCLLTIVHAANDGKTYANIASIGPLMKGMTASKPENPLTYLWIHPSRWAPDVYAGLSAGIQTVIAKSPEYQELASTPTSPADDRANDMHDDPIPF